MYFTLKYINYHEFRQQPELDLMPPSTIQIGKQKSEEIKRLSGGKVTKSKSTSLSASKPSFTTSTTMEMFSELSVASAFVENKEVLINSDCYLGSILDYILSFLMCTISTDLMNINDYALSAPGSEFFIPKETYYIVFKEYDSNGNEVFYPLLNKSSDAYTFLMSKFRKESAEHQAQVRQNGINTTSSPKLKSKETLKSKSRNKSGTSQKEGKASRTLPPIKQKN
ncbi:uncharacterized protein LOC123319081 isoform X2 [Coccinella septempunctata]|uniref:uncharacterized protein LOC123319081 isoform X2 n=1 Tax=Coccinella septempunctata TaxID=41139 RepID=UPI001D07CDC6|nr:uncharacterized protein LOC123319081 isoform X2 [Coccinella septempunctata]